MERPVCTAALCTIPDRFYFVKHPHTHTHTPRKHTSVASTRSTSLSLSLSLYVWRSRALCFCISQKKRGSVAAWKCKMPSALHEKNPCVGLCFQIIQQPRFSFRPVHNQTVSARLTCRRHLKCHSNMRCQSPHNKGRSALKDTICILHTIIYY